MAKFVLDADAAIKLQKAGALGTLASFVKCVIAMKTYEEILRGKEKMHDDAFAIEQLVEKGKVAIVKIKSYEKDGFGLGEGASLELFKKIKADGIISDDRKFISLLESQGIPFIIPTDVIAMLFIKKQMSKAEAGQALDKIRPLVRESNYSAAKRTIGG